MKLSHIRKTRAATKDLRTATLKVREVETGIQEAFVNDAIDKIDKQFLQNPANNTTGYAAWQTKSNSSGIAWKLINNLTNRKPKSVSPLPGFKNKAERAKAWTNHYSKLLYNPTDSITMGDTTAAEPELPINTSPFTAEELETALKQTKDTYGHDGIPSLLYKSVDLNDILLPLFNNMLATGKAPEELLVTAILPIPKGSKKFCPENSRGISILPVATKIYNRLLLNRIRSHIEPRLRYNQNGFRPGRGTREQILALRHIIEEAINFQLPCVISFIDFSKAFALLKTYTVLCALNTAQKHLHVTLRAAYNIQELTPLCAVSCIGSVVRLCSTTGLTHNLRSRAKYRTERCKLLHIITCSHGHV